MKKSILVLAATMFAVNVFAQSETTKSAPVTDPTSISVYPNPFDNEANVSFVLKDDATVSIRLFDSFNNLVKTFDILDAQEGFHNFQYEMSDLKSGVYFMDIIINGVNNVKRIMKL